MRKFTLLLLFIFSIIQISSQENPFSRGVNLTNWFQVNSPTEIHFTKYTKQDFENIKSLGVDVIRLPINLHSMTLGAPGYELDPLLLRFLNDAIDWAEELNINLILDNHTFDPAVSTDPNIDQILIPVWRNMADHFKDRSELLFYEILNEPHGISDAEWNEIQQSVIDAIREIDSLHTIVVGPAGWNSYNNLDNMPEYDDDNLIYTFHFYDPFIFTHQGASWSDPSLVPLAGVPFPYDFASMPELPTELEGTWVASSFYNYQNEGTISRVRELLDIVIQFKEERNVPIFCGEFGVLMDNAENNDRAIWYQVVRTYLEANGIAWTTWDYHGGFGIFKKNSIGLFDYDLNTSILSSLGFNIPPQSDFELKPDSTGFGFYSDFIEDKIVSSSYTSGVLNYYNEDSKKGEFCLSWENPSQYNNIGFRFAPIKDLSYLTANNYHIGFWVKSDNPLTKFDIRFIDTKENGEDHPWRMGMTIDNSNTIFDGNWNYVQIPLVSLNELGSWDNAWFEPQGLFNWSKVDRFEIVDEHGVLGSTQLWFDELKIFDPNQTSVEDEILASSYKLYQNYPNPFNPVTTIKFSVPVKDNNSFANVKINVYDILGRKVRTLLNKKISAGEYSIQFDGSNLPSGNYFYVLTVGDYYKVNKMTLLK